MNFVCGMLVFVLFLGLFMLIYLFYYYDIGLCEGLLCCWLIFCYVLCYFVLLYMQLWCNADCNVIFIYIGHK